MKLNVLMVGVLSLMLMACGNDAKTDDSKPVQTASTEITQTADEHNPEWQTHLVGTEPTYQPFEFKDEYGKPIGFEVDLLQAIAKNQQFNISIISDSRKNAESLLNAGKHRIWVSAFQIGVDIDARYSDSIMSFYRVIAVPENSDIKTLADLKGKKIAVNRYSSQDTINKATNLAGNVELLDQKDTFVLAIRSVLSESSDAVLGDVNMLRYYDNYHPEVSFRYININDSIGEIGFAVQKHDIGMQAKLNAGLTAIKADGTYDSILKKWFGDSIEQ